MTASAIRCVAGCPEPFTVERGDPTRCPSCGTKYNGRVVMSSPLNEVDLGALAERVESVESGAPSSARSASEPDPVPSGGTTITIQIDGNARVRSR